MTLGAWTRSKNDENTADYEENVNAQHFRYTTHSRAHRDLQTNQVRGVATGTTDWSTEPRLGQMTNLNQIQRATTNDRAFGILTTGTAVSGPLLDPRLLDSLDSLEPGQDLACKFMPASSLLNEHVLSDTTGALRAPVSLEQQSTRVSRRNQVSKCTK